MSTLYNIFATFAALTAGTVSAISNKFAYNIKADGLYPYHEFSKPCLFTVLMFIGEMLCLFYYYFDNWVKSKQTNNCNLNGSHKLLVSTDNTNNTDTLLVADDDDEFKPKPPIWYYAILSCFDLTATTLNNIGTLWVSASAVQMLRGSSVLFTGLCTVLIMKRSLTNRQWGGIGIVIIALVMVGISQVINPSSQGTQASSAQVAIGIVMILLGSLINSIQCVYEEKLLKGGDFREVDPLEVVGWEGVFGTIFSAFILLPIAQAMPAVAGQNDGGKFEWTNDSFVMMQNDGYIILCCVLFALSLGLMNNYSQVLSKNLSAIVRMLVSTCRVVLVWITGLIIGRISPEQGEFWDNYSWLQLGAFFVMVGGTMVYVKGAESSTPLLLDEDIEEGGNTK